jgi:hypothetical protein
LTPLGYITTVGTPLETAHGYRAEGLTGGSFYYPLQVWLRLVPTARVDQPAEYCVYPGPVCETATSSLRRYDFLGMDRGEGTDYVPTFYRQDFNDTPYEFTEDEYLLLMWDFPNLSPEVVEAPLFYYADQVPGEVRFYYTIRVHNAWSGAETADWPAAPLPPNAPIGWVPGEPYQYEQDIEFSPTTGAYLKMFLTKPVIEVAE